MPDKLGSSVVVISTARAHRRQRRTATCAGGRVAESMVVEVEDGRSRSDAPNDEPDGDDEVDDEDEVSL